MKHLSINITDGNKEWTGQLIVERLDCNIDTELSPKSLTPEPVVTIGELADMVKMDKSACRKYVLRCGYKPVKQRTASSSFQYALTLPKSQADEIIRTRKAEGYC